MAHDAKPQRASKFLKRKSSASGDDAAERTTKKQKSSRHDSDGEGADAVANPDLSSGVHGAASVPAKPSIAKVSRKARRGKGNSTKNEDAPPAAEEGSNDPKAAPTETGMALDSDAADVGKNQTKPRFIVFVGNLPYTATLATLESHFASLKPAFIRHITSKDDASKSKGYAFLEFAHYDRMRSCLKLFHHSMFDDGTSPARRINVELTAGGGGRGKGRKEKLWAKNQKLGEERKRAKQKQNQEKVVRNQKSEKRQAAQKLRPASGDDGNVGGVSSGAVHPSRRAMINRRN